MDDEQQQAKEVHQPAYWRGNLRLIAALTLVWLVIGFVLPLLPPEFGPDIGGASFSLWMAAQGAPIAFVLIAWFYERRMDRLDRRHRAGRDD